MKISYNWLKDYVDADIKPEIIAEILTNIGLEVESVDEFEEIRGGLKGLVIGKVLTCSKHPNADKLSLTTVNVGDDEPLQIVCGAPNVAAGQKVVVATIGTELYSGDGNFKIKKTKIRGEESNGMICAEDEIGLGTSHEGIIVLPADAVPGTPAAEYYHITSDTIFEIGLTPNRIDAASHIGVARDLAAFLQQESKVNLIKPSVDNFKTDNRSLNVGIQIDDTEGCRRFTGVTISDVTISPSPKWLKSRLRSIGLSPINNVVDITNFVLHEMGQPLHAYDADKLTDNKIIVKRLPEGTPFVTLDGEERKLSGEDVMVCDASKPVCIGGVFGGFDSGVSETTKNVFLESAYFDPVAVRKTSRRHGLFTDASFRFERGVDPQNTLVALKRAAMLIKEIAGGKISSEITDVHPAPIFPVAVDMLYSHIDRLIGKKLDHNIIKNILASLDVKVVHEKGDSLRVQVPPYRVDVTREADVIEEILRIYGYNNIDFSNKMTASYAFSLKPDNEKLVDRISEYLSDNGFNEIMSNSLTKEAYYTDLSSYPESKLVYIMNPLSTDLNVMRQTLLFGGLETIARNINHKNPNLRLYEYGRVYSQNGSADKSDSFEEIPSFALLLTGNREEQSWAVKDSPVSFFQLKAYYLNILVKAGIDTNAFQVRSLEGYDDLFNGGLEYFLGNDSVIRAGEIKDQVLSKFDIENEVYFAEISWSRLLKIAGRDSQFTDLPRFPEVRRDLALLLDDSSEYAQIEKIAFDSERKLLKRVSLFDFYKGKNIPEGKKSYAVSFYLQDLNKTLTDKEIDRIMSKITENLVKNLNAELR